MFFCLKQIQAPIIKKIDNVVELIFKIYKNIKFLRFYFYLK
jgi:hypothetical protein